MSQCLRGLICYKLQSVTKTVLYDSANFKPGTIELEALIMIYESYSGGDFQQEMTYKKCFYWSLTAFRKKIRFG